MPKNNQTYTAIQSQVNDVGIEHYYKLFNVCNPKQLMLQVIFNMLWGIKYEQDKDDPDLMNVLNRQRAIFELACRSRPKKHT
jgi:hypothetical protein